MYAQVTLSQLGKGCNRLMMRLILWLIFGFLPAVVLAQRYELPDNGSKLIGQVQVHQVKQGEYFDLIAKQYNVGMLALMAANPNIDPFLPAVGQLLTIPSHMLLPDAPRRGIVVNLPELRLYYYPKDSNEVHVFPVGIGRIGRETPQMNSKVKVKIPNPSWTPSPKLRQEYLAKYAKPLPAIVPAGPDNPLGKYAMQLAHGRGNYLIHGTNQNFGIGMRVSSGCIRLYPQDIKWLFDNTSIGESVVVINQTVKISSEPNGDKLIEVHSPLSKQNGQLPKKKTLPPKLTNLIRLEGVDRTMVGQALVSQSGMPVNFGITQ